MKTITLTCRFCGVEFQYATKEYKRQIKKGRTDADFNCSLKCHRSWLNVNDSATKAATIRANKRRKGSTRALKYKHGFGGELKKLRSRPGGNSMTDEFLHELWESQEGKCALTGVEMIHPIRKIREKLSKSPFMGSLDRIDSSKPYSKKNVQWVCYSINLAKQDFTTEEFKHFLQAI